MLACPKVACVSNFITICVQFKQPIIRFSNDSSGWKTLFLFFAFVVVVVVVVVKHVDTSFPNRLMHLFTEQKLVTKKNLSSTLKKND